MEDIFERVCRATDDEVIAEKASGFGYWHIVLTEMNTIGATLTDEFDMVVDDERGLVSVAQPPGFVGIAEKFLFGGILHPQLHPLATAFESYSDAVEIRVLIIEMRNELYHLALSSGCFIRRRRL